MESLFGKSSGVQNFFHSSLYGHRELSFKKKYEQLPFPYKCQIEMNLFPLEEVQLSINTSILQTAPLPQYDFEYVRCIRCVNGEWECNYSSLFYLRYSLCMRPCVSRWKTVTQMEGNKNRLPRIYYTKKKNWSLFKWEPSCQTRAQTRDQNEKRQWISGKKISIPTLNN